MERVFVGHSLQTAKKSALAQANIALLVYLSIADVIEKELEKLP